MAASDKLGDVVKGVAVSLFGLYGIGTMPATVYHIVAYWTSHSFWNGFVWAIPYGIARGFIWPIDVIRWLCF